MPPPVTEKASTLRATGQSSLLPSSSSSSSLIMCGVAATALGLRAGVEQWCEEALCNNENVKKAIVAIISYRKNQQTEREGVIPFLEQALSSSISGCPSTNLTGGDRRRDSSRATVNKNQFNDEAIQEKENKLKSELRQYIEIALKSNMVLDCTVTKPLLKSTLSALLKNKTRLGNLNLLPEEINELPALLNDTQLDCLADTVTKAVKFKQKNEQRRKELDALRARLPQKGLIWGVDITPTGQNAASSGHQVQKVEFNEELKIDSIGFFKPVNEDDYPPLLAMYSVAESQSYKMTLGDRASEERLVFNKKGELIGTVSIGIKNFRSFDSTELLEDDPKIDTLIKAGLITEEKVNKLLKGPSIIDLLEWNTVRKEFLADKETGEKHKGKIEALLQAFQENTINVLDAKALEQGPSINDLKRWGILPQDFNYNAIEINTDFSSEEKQELLKQLLHAVQFTCQLKKTLLEKKDSQGCPTTEKIKAWDIIEKLDSKNTLNILTLIKMYAIPRGFLELTKTREMLTGELLKKMRLISDRQLIGLRKPTSADLITLDAASVLVASWLHQEDDLHPGNIGVLPVCNRQTGKVQWLVCRIDYDMSVYPITSIIKGKRRVCGVFYSLPERATKLQEQHLVWFPCDVGEHTHFPTHTPLNGPWGTHMLVGKDYKAREAFKALRFNTKFREQMFRALVKEILAFQPKALEARLKAYIGDAALTLEQLHSDKQKELLEKFKPIILTDAENARSFIDHYMLMTKERDASLRKIVLGYRNDIEEIKVKYGDDAYQKIVSRCQEDKTKDNVRYGEEQILKQFDIRGFIGVQRKILARMEDWFNEQNEKQSEAGIPKDALFNIEEARGSFRQLFHDAYEREKESYYLALEELKEKISDAIKANKRKTDVICELISQEQDQADTEEKLKEAPELLIKLCEKFKNISEIYKINARKKEANKTFIDEIKKLILEYEKQILTVLEGHETFHDIFTGWMGEIMRFCEIYTLDKEATAITPGTSSNIYVSYSTGVSSASSVSKTSYHSSTQIQKQAIELIEKALDKWIKEKSFEDIIDNVNEALGIYTSNTEGNSGLFRLVSGTFSQAWNALSGSRRQEIEAFCEKAKENKKGVEETGKAPNIKQLKVKQIGVKLLQTLFEKGKNGWNVGGMLSKKSYNPILFELLIKKMFAEYANGERYDEIRKQYTFIKDVADWYEKGQLTELPENASFFIDRVLSSCAMGLTGEINKIEAEQEKVQQAAKQEKAELTPVLT